MCRFGWGSGMCWISYAGVFGAGFMSRVELGRPAFDLATELRAHAALKTPDALHLAAALVAGCTAFWTRDQRLAAAASGRIAPFDLFTTDAQE